MGFSMPPPPGGQPPYQQQGAPPPAYQQQPYVPQGQGYYHTPSQQPGPGAYPSGPSSYPQQQPYCGGEGGGAPIGAHSAPPPSQGGLLGKVGPLLAGGLAGTALGGMAGKMLGGHGHGGGGHGHGGGMGMGGMMGPAAALGAGGLMNKKEAKKQKKLLKYGLPLAAGV